MFVFWTLQTVCFALYSIHGNLAAAHTFIAMICTFTDLFPHPTALTAWATLQSCSTDSVSRMIYLHDVC